MKKVAIFGSGNGSNFEEIIKYFMNKPIEFVCISDVSDSYILKRAKRLNIEYYHVSFENTYEFLKENKFDLYVLAGYMRVLPIEIINNRTFINIHPSLLPKYKGLNAIKRAYENTEIKTGVSIHYVTDKLDSGEIIAQEEVLIDRNMSLDKLEAKVHAIEHKLYPKVIEQLLV